MSLLILVADLDQKAVFETLLKDRIKSLGICACDFDIKRHPNRDSGVYKCDFVPRPHGKYDHLLIVLDKEWEGSPNNVGAIQTHIKDKLHRMGWHSNACEVIVIDPEIEIWVWIPGDTHLLTQLGFSNWAEIYKHRCTAKYWDLSQVKPYQPKELLEALMRAQRRHLSQSLFENLAKRVSLSRCQDPAFVLLRDTLQRWFPA